MERHRLDALSLIFGLLFVALAAVGLTNVFTLTAADLRWLGPALLVVVGIALLVTAGGGRKERPGDGRDDRAVDAARSGDGPVRSEADTARSGDPDGTGDGPDSGSASTHDTEQTAPDR